MQLDLAYSPKDQADLENLLRHIGRDDRAAARLWVQEIVARCENLRSFPEVGPERPDISDGLRIFPFRRAVIAYRILPSRIRIVRVLYGGQDYAALMG